IDSDSGGYVLCYISKLSHLFSKRQLDQIHLLACDQAEQSIHHFEDSFPSDKRLSLALEETRRWLRGEISYDELRKAFQMSYDARQMAESVMECECFESQAADCVSFAVSASIDDLYDCSFDSYQTNPISMDKALKELFLKWESEKVKTTIYSDVDVSGVEMALTVDFYINEYDANVDGYKIGDKSIEIETVMIGKSVVTMNMQDSDFTAMILSKIEDAI
ncbi:MAG: putative immunity protein, partial [Glaciecola sp.]